MESQCLINITNFIKAKNHFNHFLSIFAFFHMLQWIFFWHKYTLTSHHIKKITVISLEFDLFRFWPTIICKKIMKILHNNDRVEVQTWDPPKKCDNNLGPLIMCFHPIGYWANWQSHASNHYFARWLYDRRVLEC
jgi:hypothetical protein